MHNLGAPATIIFGLPGSVFFLWMSAIFFTITFLVFWKGYRGQGERDELTTAFTAFLLGMAIFHIILGAAELYKNEALILLAVLVAFIGSTYTLRFPLSTIKEPWRSWIFYSVFAGTLLYMIAAVIYSYPIDSVVKTVFWYMIIASGGVSGLYALKKGFEAKTQSVRIKCIGGGAGIITCCLVADLMVVFAGVTIIGEMLMSAAPVILLGSVIHGRRQEEKEQGLITNKNVAI